MAGTSKTFFKIWRLYDIIVFPAPGALPVPGNAEYADINGDFPPESIEGIEAALGPPAINKAVSPTLCYACVKVVRQGGDQDGKVSSE